MFPALWLCTVPWVAARVRMSHGLALSWNRRKVLRNSLPSTFWHSNRSPSIALLLTVAFASAADCESCSPTKGFLHPNGYQNRGLVVIPLHQILTNYQIFDVVQSSAFSFSFWAHDLQKSSNHMAPLVKPGRKFYADFVSLGPWDCLKIFLQLIPGQALVKAPTQNTPTSRA